MLTLLIYCVLIAAVSLVGGWLPGMIRFTHVRLHALMSLVAGFMLGIACFHMLPHSVEHGGSLDSAMLYLMIGLLGMFFLVRALHFHQHGSVENTVELPPCDHDHDDSHSHHHGTQHSLSWTGVFVGLTIHTLIDGVALATAVAASLGAGESITLAGIGTFLAIALHKPLDSMSITTLMAAGGWSRQSQWKVNVTYALVCPLAAVLFFLLLDMQLSDSSTGQLVPAALAFSAGVFLCIALGDLLPEIQFHSHDRIKYSACLLAGVILAWTIRYVEPPHLHGPARSASPSETAQ
ncbi:MAG: ZIP family metal transporter [Planctomycetota bacterium]|nr:ZIP family metal transporter [Planctomycetota bacterium]